MTSLFVLYEAL